MQVNCALVALTPHYALLDAGNGKLEYRKYVSGSLSSATTSVSATINADTAYTLKVDRSSQGHVTAWIDGQSVSISRHARGS
jgi:hypothetical protein